MKYHFNNNLFRTNTKGFSLIEATAGLVILAIICSSSLVIINRAVQATTDSTLKMRAFEVARENMEKLLLTDKVSETTEHGYSEKYPEIEWTTTVETFYEPINNKMWARAICSAQYYNSKGQIDEVKLTCWLTKLSEKQVQQILADQQKMKDLLGITQPAGDQDSNVIDINDNRR